MKAGVFLPLWVDMAASSCLCTPLRRYCPGRCLLQLFDLNVCRVQLAEGQEYCKTSRAMSRVM